MNVFLSKKSYLLTLLVHWAMALSVCLLKPWVWTLPGPPNPQGRTSLPLHSENAFICCNLQSLVPGDFPACLLSAWFLPTNSDPGDT